MVGAGLLFNIKLFNTCMNLILIRAVSKVNVDQHRIITRSQTLTLPVMLLRDGCHTYETPEKVNVTGCPASATLNWSLCSDYVASGGQRTGRFMDSLAYQF